MYFEYGEDEITYLRNKDKKLAEVIDRIGMIEREVDTDLFSSVVHHIIGQQISTKAQATIWQRMKDALGEVNAETILAADISELQSLGMTFRKAEYIKDFAGKKFRCKQWCDILHLTTAKVYAEYGESFYKCCPAVTMNKYCNGMAYYVGTVCEPEFYESFAGNLMVQAKIPRLKGLPKGVEVVTRTNGINEYIFFFNNSNETVMINLPKSMYSIIDSRGKDVIRLIPFDVDIVRK